MVLITVVIILSILVFAVAFVSPRKGTKAQQHSMKFLYRFLQQLRRLPQFLHPIVTKPPIASHKVIHKSAELGKKARKKTTSSQ